jgi:hypothetical protein
MSYYIQANKPHGIRYWDGKEWSFDTAKGYSSYKRAERTLLLLLKKSKTFSDEAEIKDSLQELKIRDEPLTGKEIECHNKWLKELLSQS